LRAAVFVFFATLLLGQQPDVPEHLAAARKAEAAGDFALAEHEYEQSLKQTRDPEVLQRLGLVRHLQNKFVEAIPPLEQAIELRPDLWGAQLFLGIDLYRTNQFAKALPHLKAAQQFQPRNFEIRFWLGATNLALKNTLTGLEILEDLLRDQPDNRDVAKLLAQTYASYSAVLFNSVGEKYPDTAPGFQVQGQALEFEGFYDAAIDAYRSSLSLQPKRPGVHAAIARILQIQGKTAEAAQELQKENRIP
jgi:tetratricopeptide (TPR) repeat protein